IDPSRLAGDGKSGRIWRITWGGTTEQPALAPRSLDAWAKLRKLSDDELLKKLASENGSDRRQAQLELVKRGEKQRPGLIRLLEDTEASLPARLTALGALHRFWNAEVAEAMKGRLVDSDPDVRRLAVEALGVHGAAKGTEAIG